MTTGAALGWYGTYVPTVFLFVSDSYHVEGVVSHCMYILGFNRHFFLMEVEMNYWSPVLSLCPFNQSNF